MQTRMIEIDFQVHQMIELERQSFDDTPNAVLRRKYGLPAEPQPAGSAEAEPNSTRQPKEPPLTTADRPWVGKGKSTGLLLPHGTQLRMDYNGHRFAGRVDNGSLVFEGQRFNSPSGAADAICKTRSGSKTSLNGKTLISACLPGDTKWVLLKTMEERMRNGRVTA